MEKLAFNLSIFLTVVAVLILTGAASSKLAAIISRCSLRVSTVPLHTAKPLSYILSRIASWVNVPVLVMFLGVGMLAGSEGFGGIRYEDPFPPILSVPSRWHSFSIPVATTPVGNPSRA